MLIRHARKLDDHRPLRNAARAFSAGLLVVASLRLKLSAEM